MSNSTGNVWNIPGLPHRGWECIGIVDLNPDELPSDDVDYGTCEACGQYPIRFVHSIVHDDWPEVMEVGCVCSEHLTDDYVNPRRNEQELQKRAAARSRWLKRKWRVSAKGAYWLKIKGHHMAVFRDKFCDGWRCSFDREFGRLTHPTKELAMLALFNKFDHVSRSKRP